MVGTASSVTGSEVATAVGVAGPFLAFSVSKVTNRRVPPAVHLALRMVATDGVVQGVALSLPGHVGVPRWDVGLYGAARVKPQPSAAVAAPLS